MSTNDNLTNEMRQAAPTLYSSSDGTRMGDLVIEAANRLDAAEKLLKTADEMMKSSLDFTYGIGVDGELRPVKNRAMSAMRAYASGRGIPVKLPHGEIWD